MITQTTQPTFAPTLVSTAMLLHPFLIQLVLTTHTDEATSAPADNDSDDDNDECHPDTTLDAATGDIADSTNVTLDTTVTNKTALTAETGSLVLVAEPKKVTKYQINYAKAAKKVDVKALKNNLWVQLRASSQVPR